MNTLILKRHVILAAASLCILVGSGASALDAQEKRRVIDVKTVGQLYAAVNDSANRYVTVRLAPGTYVLSTFRKDGSLRPNEGGLRMPRGMSLVGSEKHVDTDGDGVPDPISEEMPDDFTVPGTETVLDGSGLVLTGAVREDCAGGTFGGAPNPMIQVGVNNQISHLTVYSGNNVAISEPSNNPVDPNGNLSMTVSDSVLQGSFLILGFSNCECAARRAHSVLNLSRSVVHGTNFIGVLIQNFLTGDASNDSSDGPAIRATLTSNLIYGNSRALIVNGGNKGTDGGSVTLFMHGNVFRNNQVNFQGFGAGAGFLTPAVGNRLIIRSESDTFGEAFSNLVLVAGPSEIDNDPKGSVLDAKFGHSRFIRDFTETPAEISIGGGGGIHNRAEVLVRGATVRTSDGAHAQGALLIQDGPVPDEGTSKARLAGSRQEFIDRNQGLPAPPAKFFLEHPLAGGG